MAYVNKALLCIFLSIAVLCSWLKPMDSTAIQQIDIGLERAIVSFATARALNAGISVLQGTELAFEPGGIGVNTTPGQLLDPINDLVEQFSTLMLAASVAFGVEKILIMIGGFWLISLVLTAVSIGWLWFYFRQNKPPTWLSKTLIVLLMIRFAIPLVTIASDFLFQNFMSEQYQTSLTIITSASDQVEKLNLPDSTSPDDKGYWERAKERLKELWEDTKAKVDFANVNETAENWVLHIIKLMGIFLMQTLIIPLLLIWALYAVVKGTFEFPINISKTTYA